MSAVSWQTDNSAVATVLLGLVTGVSPGTAHITATSQGKSTSITVTVAAVQTSLINLNAAVDRDLYVDVADGAQNVAITGVVYDLGLSPLLAPLISWQSLNPELVSVNSSGVVTVNPGATQSGVATVKASANVLGIGLLSTTYKIYVYNEPKQVSDLYLASPILNLNLGVAQTDTNIVALDQLNKVILNADIDHSSSNPNSVLVDQNGNILTLNVGSSLITGTSNGHSATYFLNVAL